MLRYRPMRPRDVRDCVEIVSLDARARTKYGDALGSLRSIWLDLIGREAFRAFVFEELTSSVARTIAFGISVAVSDDFLHDLKEPPFFWVGPELVRRIARGESPLLSDKDVRAANSTGNVGIVVWEGLAREEEHHRPEVPNLIMSAFIQEHRGFFLKELWGHGESAVGLRATIHSGTFFLRTHDGRTIDHLDEPAEDILAKPHVIGLTRELALQRIGTWSGSLFIYQPPRFGFRPSEQRLLLTALRGGTDAELADELTVSLSAVKKAWRAIYERVSDKDPHLVPSVDFGPNGASERGKEKKQRLLAYLREHLEELRPAAP